MGLKEPDAGSEIGGILDEYQKYKGQKTDPILHFERIFNYYKTAPRTESDKMMSLIKKVGFKFKVVMSGKRLDASIVPDIMYFPEDHIVKYFTGSDVFFLDIESYLAEFGEESELMLFFERLGVNRLPRLIKTQVGVEEIKEYGIKAPIYNISATKYVIEGLLTAVNRVQFAKNKELSINIWNILCKLSIAHNGNLANEATGVANIKRKRTQEIFIPKDLVGVRSAAWIVGKEDEFYSPTVLTNLLMDPEYDVSNPSVKDVCSLIGMTYSRSDLDFNINNLNEDQKKAVDLYKILMDSGVPIDELKRFLEDYKKERSIAAVEAAHADEKEPIDQTINNLPHGSSIPSQTTNSTSKIEEPQEQMEEMVPKEPAERSQHSKNNDVRRPKKYDVEEFNKEALNETDLLRKAKERYDAEIMLIARQEELHIAAAAAGKYTYRWFKSLLELESLNDPVNDNHEMSIHFGKIEQESANIVLLKNPNKPIPMIIEDVSGFPLQLLMNGQIHRIMAESASIHSFVLRVKLHEPAAIKNIDLVTDVGISIQDPSFLYESLTEKFSSLNLDDDYNFQTSLNKDIKFIFGPPGTGKTTKLASMIVDKMGEIKKGKILIVTPTNKSADVIAEKIGKILQNEGTICSLARFGNTSNPYLEAAGLWKDRTFNIDGQDKTILVTTIARFYYDHIGSREGLKNLDAIDWDTIIADEASMIRLIDMVYLLKKAEGSSFIISGDPFQIEPIVNEEEWEGENIYSITGLNKPDSFVHPQTVPHDYEIERLMVQYRSTPTIGNLYSNLTYGGLLIGSRDDDNSLRLSPNQGLETQAVNVIKFPVKQYESIFRSKRLEGGSCYHIYSALLCLEYVKYLNERFKESYPDRDVSIGVISPYKVQADLVEKMINRDTSDTGIQVGTIHSFQGDECDVIVLLLNTPPRITNSSRLSVNKLNIINVAISRARDNLFIMMPDEETFGVENLAIINRLLRLVDKSNYYEIKSSQVEEMIFGKSNYIEANTFSTTHQNVNIYSLPEVIYEVRSDESSIDIQIHREDMNQ